MTKTEIFLLILVLSYNYGIPCSAEAPMGTPEWKEEERIRFEWEIKDREEARARKKKVEAAESHMSHARKRAEQARDAAAEAEKAAASCDWGKYREAVEKANKRLASAKQYRDKAEAISNELFHNVSKGYDAASSAINILINSAHEALWRAASAMERCRKPLLRSIWEGIVGLTVTGVGTTTGLSLALTNNTDSAMEVVIPTGTQLTTTAKGFQPYQTGYNPPIALGPKETVTKEIVVFCTDNSLAPAPKDDPSVTYTMPEGPPTPQQEKITELIVTTNQLRKIYSIGPVEHTFEYELDEQGNVIEQVETTRDDRGEVKIQIVTGFDVSGDAISRAEVTYDGPNVVKEKRSEITYEKDREGNIVTQVEVTSDGRVKVERKYDEQGNVISQVEVTYGDQGEIVVQKERSKIQYDNLGNVVRQVEVTYDGSNVAKEERSEITYEYDSPGRVIRQTEVIYDAKGEAVTQKERSNIQYDSRGRTIGEVTVTRPYGQEISQGPYEKANPEKFWESVQLYTIWRETNKIGKNELSKLMEEQFKEKYPVKKARKLGEQVAEEIIGRVDKVYESHKELKEEGIDFSTLDPTLKWRKT